MTTSRRTETLHFSEDGNVPNSKLPLVIHHQVLLAEMVDPEVIEQTFLKNNWSNNWRGQVYDYHHFHSNTHEALGVYKGTALLLIGGENGQRLQVYAGDILVLPAGTGHKCLEKSEDFALVAGYPAGSEYDLMKADEMTESKLNHAKLNIQKVEPPVTDPWYGAQGPGVQLLWRERTQPTSKEPTYAI